MRDLLRTLAAHGRTVLLSSHLLAEMKLLADDLIIIAAGQLAARGTVASIVSSMTHGGRILVRTPEVEKLAAALGSDAVVTPAGDGDVYLTGVDAVAIGTPRSGRASPSISSSPSARTWKRRSSTHRGKGGDQMTLLDSPVLDRARDTGTTPLRLVRAEIMKIRTTNIGPSSGWASAR